MKNKNNITDLVGIIQTHIDSEIDSLISSTIIEILELKYRNKENYENTLLRYIYNENDFFKLLIINTSCELFYFKGLIKEDFYSFKNIPKGNNYAYGNYFQEKMIEYISNIENIKNYKYKLTDRVLEYKNKLYILECKCNKTNTKAQIDKYIEMYGIDNFITINGHDNIVRITVQSIIIQTENYINNIYAIGNFLNKM